MRNIRNCSVAVVGGAGFLGSHLVDHLIEDRLCQVVVLDNLVAGHKKFIHPQASFEHVDITDSESYLCRLFDLYGVEYVFNYAAYPYIPDSFARPLHVFEVNATGAIKVINAAQEAGCEGILQVSSAEIYGERTGETSLIAQTNCIDEEEIVRPHSTYGVAKAAVDYYCQTAWRERQTPVIALRQYNCVGPRETHPYVVPEIISQISKIGKPGENPHPIVKLGNNSFRDFQYAGDAVRMAVELLEKGQFGEVYNMGSQDGIQIYDLAQEIGKLMGYEISILEDQTRKRPWEIWYLRSDNSKLYQTIETRPQTSLREALEETIAYFRSNGEKWCWEPNE